MDDPGFLADFIAEDGLTFGLFALTGLAFVVFGVITLVQSRQDVRRRAGAGISVSSGAASAMAPRPAFSRIVDRLQGTFAVGDTRENRVLRKQLIQAGFYDQRAVAVYFAARVVCALVVGALGLVGVPFLLSEPTQMWGGIAAAAIIGYLAPSTWLKRRIERRTTQHRAGFPDFMDLMVVCAEAGLSTEAAIDRIARELVEGYPSLAENLYMASLEIRAGKSFPEALEHMSERLGIDEAGMLATLLQQSAELGTSLALSLRVYSDEMRNKRMSRAEEKAYALPAKLVVPLTLFVFPVLITTLMFPVVLRMSAVFKG